MGREEREELIWLFGCQLLVVGCRLSHRCCHSLQYWNTDDADLANDRGFAQQHE
jgi:hypothetical protein